MHSVPQQNVSILNYSKTTQLSRYDTVLRGFVKEVCISGRPLEIVNDSGMQDLTGNVSVSSEALDIAIESYYQKAKNNLMSEIKDKLFSLKIDCATRFRKSFLGINIQYCSGEPPFTQITSRNLSVIELHCRHTGKNLSDSILKVLPNLD